MFVLFFFFFLVNFLTLFFCFIFYCIFYFFFFLPCKFFNIILWHNSSPHLVIFSDFFTQLFVVLTMILYAVHQFFLPKFLPPLIKIITSQDLLTDLFLISQWCYIHPISILLDGE